MNDDKRGVNQRLYCDIVVEKRYENREDRRKICKEKENKNCKDCICLFTVQSIKHHLDI